MVEFTRDVYPQYEIGRWTYGHPEVASWGEGTTLKIGAFCSIASGVKILLGGEHRADWVTTYPFSGPALQSLWPGADQIKGHPNSKGDVVIGNDVWLGMESVILSGVQVGSGAVVGTRAVVTQDIPPYAIAFGNPARVLRYRFDQETIAELLEIAWWNWDDEKIKAMLPYLLCPDIRQFIAAAGIGK